MVSVVLLSAWLGAALFFSAIVAQAAFRVLPTRTLAGALVGRTLPVIFVTGVVVGLVVALLAFRDPEVASGRMFRLTTALGTAIFCAIAQFGIGTRINQLRASLGTTLDALPSADPLRVSFGRWHALSVLALGLAMLFALGTLVVTFRQLTLSTPYRT